jgi:hypothetical protein
MGLKGRSYKKNAPQEVKQKHKNTTCMTLPLHCQNTNPNKTQTTPQTIKHLNP